MINTRLIMLEGLPSTGKTTNSRFIHIQLERSRMNAKWIHEVAMPQPVLFFDEAGLTQDEYQAFKKAYPGAADTLDEIAVLRESTVGIHLPETEWHYMDKVGEKAYRALMEYDVWNFPLDKYKKFALEKWAHFTKNALAHEDEVCIIDSAVFQFQVFTFLFKNRPYEELRRFVAQITDIIRPLNPCLIYLYRENTEMTIDYLQKDRGASYLEYLWNRDKAQPYYADKPSGAESFKQFLRDYAGMAGKLFQWFPANKIAIEISDGNWARHEDEMLAFLETDRHPNPDAFPPIGVYVNEAHGFQISVNGLSFTDPTGQTRKLYPKSQNAFYVDWLPTVLRFENNQIVISGSQINERWTATGTRYDKIE